MAAKETILVVGRGALAGDVVRALVAQKADRRIVTVLTTSPTSTAGAHHIDLSDPGCSRALAELMLEIRPTTLALIGFSESPVTPPLPWSSDAALADIAVSALERLIEQGVRAPSILVLTSTMVYGVAVSSPLVYDERSNLPRESAFSSTLAHWAEGLRAVERRLVAWAVGRGVHIGVLRAANVLGGPMDSPVARLLGSALPVRVAGYDPPFQVVHYMDLVDAIVLAIDQHCGEVLNIVGRAVVPLSALLAMAGVFAPPLPGPVADRLAPTAMDGDHLRWRVLADGRRATALLGFHPSRSIEDCLR